MVNVLLKSQKYTDKYVAIISVDNPKVMGSGDTPFEAYQKSIENGCSSPTIVFVPRENMTQIY